MLRGVLLVARNILKPQLDAKLELWCTFIYRKDERPLASSASPEEDDLIELLVEEIPHVLSEG